MTNGLGCHDPGHHRLDHSKRFLAALFLSGGGVVEVLALKRDDFKIREGEDLIINFIKAI
jgi:hypothetical protein